MAATGQLPHTAPHVSFPPHRIINQSSSSHVRFSDDACPLSTLTAPPRRKAASENFAVPELWDFFGGCCSAHNNPTTRHEAARAAHACPPGLTNVQTPAVAPEDTPHVPCRQHLGGPSGRAIDPRPSPCLNAPGGCVHAVASAQSTLALDRYPLAPPHTGYARYRESAYVRAVLVTARTATTAAPRA